LQVIIDEITAAYLEIRQDENFHRELADLYRHYVGSPSPLFHARRLSGQYGTDIYLKREDLNHTGAHKINHCLGEALLAESGEKGSILINLSGRGDKDLDFVVENYGANYDCSL